MATTLSNTTASVERLDSGASDGCLIGGSATAKVAFYGGTPVVQRASAVQAASVVSATSYISVTSNLAAFCAEVAATLTGLKLWKGTA
jgi:hypothetical protein